MMRVKKFFILLLSVTICITSFYAYSLYSSKERIDASTEVKGLIVTGIVEGKVGEELDGAAYVDIELVDGINYGFDDNEICIGNEDKLNLNLEGDLVYEIIYADQSIISLAITGHCDSELICDLIVNIDGEYILDNFDNPQSGSYYTNGEGSEAHIFIEPGDDPSASIVENKNYTFIKGKTIDKDIIKIEIRNDAIIGNIYEVNENFIDTDFNGLKLKVDSIEQYGSYIKAINLFLDGTPNASGVITIDNLVIPYLNRTFSIDNGPTGDDLLVEGSIKITINDPYVPPVKPQVIDDGTGK